MTSDVRPPASGPPTDPGRQFGEAYLTTLASDLGLPQLTLVIRAESIRDQGLALVRSGQFDEAAQTLHLAGEMCRRVNLSHHGFHAARTFQAAAEAFLAYRLQRHEEAENLTHESIESARILGDEYGHDMEFRKVHLCRNILRARCFVKPVAEVVESTIGLLLYCAGERTRWPLSGHHAWSTWRPLSPSELLWTVDETVANLSLPALDLQRHDVSDRWDTVWEEQSLASLKTDVRSAIREWLFAIVFAHEQRMEASRDHAWRFLEWAPAEFMQLRQAIEYVVLQREQARRPEILQVATS